MRLGLIADSHDRLPAVRALLAEFRARGVELILHAGDFCAPFTLEPFVSNATPTVGVFGRNDGDREGLRAAAATSGLATELFESPHSFELDGKSVLLVHDLGEVQPRSMDAHAIVVHGCSHKAERTTRGEVLLVNPGEACGWVTGSPSAAILDLDSNDVEFITLDADDLRG
jgi:putative phosphoesterase